MHNHSLAFLVISQTQMTLAGEQPALSRWKFPLAAEEGQIPQTSQHYNNLVLLYHPTIFVSPDSFPKVQTELEII